MVFAKHYDRKTPLTAAEILNDRVLPFFEEHGIVLCRVLTDRGTEYCGNPEQHDYELYLAVEDVDHTRTNQAPTDQWNLRALPSNSYSTSSIAWCSARKFIGFRRAADRSRCLGEGVQRNASASGTVVLWKNANANLP